MSSILNFVKVKKTPEPPPPPEPPMPEMKCHLSVMLKDSAVFRLTKPYNENKTLDEHWAEFMAWYRADIAAKSFTLSYVATHPAIGQKTFVRDYIMSIEIHTEVKEQA